MTVWLPIDFYVGVSVSRERLLEVPTYTSDRMQGGRRALRLEWSLLVNVCLILDLQRSTVGQLARGWQ